MIFLVLLSKVSAMKEFFCFKKKKLVKFSVNSNIIFNKSQVKLQVMKCCLLQNLYCCLRNEISDIFQTSKNPGISIYISRWIKQCIIFILCKVNSRMK